LVVLVFVTCDDPDSFELPGVYINFSINIKTDVQYYSLQAASNSMNIDAQMVGVSTLGYDNNGVILFNSGNDIHAFDRTCPYDFPVSVQVSSDGSVAVCPTCGSVFLLTATGAIPSADSPAKYPLKEYNTNYFSATGALQVSN
jgi:nitrite reductase/ring-hydroxylating ferredoxin subunit